MKLKEEEIKNREAWEKAGYRLPRYDREQMIRETKEQPFWVHFGAGNIFRAFQANVVQNLLNADVLDRGLIVAEGYDDEIIEKIYHPHDNYSILATLKADGTIEKTVIGSIAEALVLDPGKEKDKKRLQEIFEKDSLQMASFTITEKGYVLTDGKGEFLASVQSDFEKGPERPASYIGRVASLLYARFLAGEKPIAMVSMDNCSHNGDKLYTAINTFAGKWEEKGLVKKGFQKYVNDKSRVSFPLTMIDKITPRPDASVEKILKQDGIEDTAPVITAKNTYVAPFVNAEECEYLVIEDVFPNGREALEKGGLMAIILGFIGLETFCLGTGSIFLIGFHLANGFRDRKKGRPGTTASVIFIGIMLAGDVLVLSRETINALDNMTVVALSSVILVLEAMLFLWINKEVLRKYYSL